MKKFFLKGPVEAAIDSQAAFGIFYRFIYEVRGDRNRELKFYNIRPDFLTTIEEYEKSDYTKPGYFENCGRDFVLGILVCDKEMLATGLKILMTNGYG